MVMKPPRIGRAASRRRGLRRRGGASVGGACKTGKEGFSSESEGAWPRSGDGNSGPKAATDWWICIQEAWSKAEGRGLAGEAGPVPGSLSGVGGCVFCRPGLQKSWRADLQGSLACGAQCMQSEFTSV